MRCRLLEQWQQCGSAVRKMIPPGTDQQAANVAVEGFRRMFYLGASAMYNMAVVEIGEPTVSEMEAMLLLQQLEGEIARFWEEMTNKQSV